MTGAARDEHLRDLLADRVFDAAFVVGPDGAETWRRPGADTRGGDTAAGLGTDARPGTVAAEDAILLDRLHPDDRAQARFVLDDLVAHPGRRTAFTARMRSDDGERWRPAELIAVGLTQDPLVAGILVGTRLVEQDESDLADSARRVLSAAAAAPVGLGCLTAAGALRWANGAFSQLTGLRPGQSPADDDEPTATARAEIARVLAHLLEDGDATSTIALGDRYVRFHARWLRDEADAGPSVPQDLATRTDDILLSAEDVSPALAAATDQAAAEATFRAAFDHSHAGIALVALDGRFLRLNPAWLTITGYDEHQLVGRTFAEITHPDDLEADEAYVRELLEGGRDSYRMEKRYLHRSGGIVWVDLRVVVVRDQFRAPVHFVSTIIDISERKGIEDTLRADNASLSYRATHDHLTGLPNRHLLEEHLKVALHRAQVEAATTCILMADLDRFKAVNDIHGHTTGDAVLVEVANRLRGVCREGDIVARWGGDEFLIVAETARYPETATRLAARLVDAVTSPIQVGDTSTAVGVSIGITRVRAADTIERAVERADEAAYVVKQTGGGLALAADDEPEREAEAELDPA